MAHATVKVDVNDPVVQSKLKGAGIRWRMNNMRDGLEVDAKVAKELGITEKALKAEEKAVEKSAVQHEADAKAEVARQAAITAKAKADADAQAEADAKAAAKAAKGK